MRSKIAAYCLLALLFFSPACKKDISSAIIGNWISVSDFTMQANGIYMWTPVDRYPQSFSFSSEGRFSSFTDVPGGTGKYNYDGGLQQLTLSYEADGYGNIPNMQNFKVETITSDKLVLSYFSPANNLVFKTEYLRVN